MHFAEKQVGGFIANLVQVDPLKISEELNSENEFGDGIGIIAVFQVDNLVFGHNSVREAPSHVERIALGVYAQTLRRIESLNHELPCPAGTSSDQSFPWIEKIEDFSQN